jgi:hypothetical protein
LQLRPHEHESRFCRARFEDFGNFFGLGDGDSRPGKIEADLASNSAAMVAASIVIGVAADAVIKSIISTIAIRSLLMVSAFAVLIPLLVVAAVKLLKFAQGASFQRFGGWATGAVATTILGCYVAHIFIDASSTYSGLESAQRALLTSVAAQRTTGVDYQTYVQSTALKVSGSGDGALTATSTTFDGTVVIQAQTGGIDVYWDNGKHYSLGTIYQGVLQHEPDGDGLPDRLRSKGHAYAKRKQRGCQ